MKHLILAALLCLPCAAPQAAAGPSEPSRSLSDLSATVVGGSVLLTAMGGSVVVESVRASGDFLEVVLRGTAGASMATVRLSAKVAGGLSLGAGTVLEVLASSAGQVLVLSGKAIAFIPNEAGKALLHHARAN